ncbi:hypothetical protein ILYODFUR_024270, partial [Ilyodon furcidens]
IDQDIHRKYTLSSDAELILIRSLTLGKVIRVESFDEDVVKAASKGFVGCLSSVQFNHVAPLKAALTNRGSSLITIRGPLVQSNCGALAESTSHVLQGVEYSVKLNSNVIKNASQPLNSEFNSEAKMLGFVPPIGRSASLGVYGAVGWPRLARTLSFCMMIG